MEEPTHNKYIVTNRMEMANGRNIHQWGKLREDNGGWDDERASELYAIESESTSCLLTQI